VVAIWPVILSGGVGSRLWPLSRAESPKQLLPLAGDRAMIVETALRTAGADGFEQPLIVTGAAQAAQIEQLLAEAGIAPGLSFVEPSGRNTAPAIALPAAWLERSGRGEALLLVMPSDHVIADVPAFRAAVDRAAPVARDGWLVTFGIAPDSPQTGYGYIEMGGELGTGVREVARFVEKPARELAEAYLAHGGYAWNGGIFLMRVDRYLEELQRHAPLIAAAVDQAVARADRAGSRLVPEAAAWAACPSDSIDYAVMEKAARVAVVPVSMGWSDIGSWDALHAVAEPDAEGNVIRGDVIALDSANCLLRSEGPLIAVVGVEGLTVVATSDAVLILPRGRTQEVKRIVDELKARGRPEPERHGC